MKCPEGAPKWLQWAWHEIGTHEVPQNRGPAIRRYVQLAHAGEEGDQWCAIFANAALESAGIHGTRSPSSLSFRHSDLYTELAGPSLGAVAVFWRISRHAGTGHVGFYCGERGGYVWTLGGNEHDMVQIEFLAKAGSRFGLIGYFWPKSVPHPEIKRILVDHHVPAHQVSVT